MNTDWLHKRAEISPNSLAVMDAETNKCWSYKDLDIRANNLANYLLNEGVKKGDRVCILSSNDIAYLDLLFACTKIGAIFVPINCRLSECEISYIIKDCEPEFIVTSIEKEHVIKSLFHKEKLIVNSKLYQKIVTDSQCKRSSFEKVENKDALAIIYTSGTTGYPKGVVITHQSSQCNSFNTIISWNLSENDITVSTMPMFHTAGLFALTIPLLMIGGKVIIQKKFDEDETIKIVEKEKCTIIFMVPTMYYLFVQSKYFKFENLQSVRNFISGGAPCPNNIYQAFNDNALPFKEAYGLTEAGPNNFFIHPSIAKVKRGSVGKPIMFCDVKIIEENGAEVEIGQVGELVISGDHIFEHYWKKSNETKKVLVDGQFHTGDLARQDSDGFFYIVGRKKDIIISGGENIYPTEVEIVLSQHSAISEAAVVGVPDKKWGELVTAMVTLGQNQAVSENELQDYCRQKLGGYKIPRKIHFVDHLPLSSVGKIDKKRIVEISQESNQPSKVI